MNAEYAVNYIHERLPGGVFFSVIHTRDSALFFDFQWSSRDGEKHLRHAYSKEGVKRAETTDMFLDEMIRQVGVALEASGFKERI